ncbi:MAG: hypothetical protein V7K89_25875, partial [Nostoc sp.]|uniref:hypothetical protein n=1 Tax=Nostoc sp. TaxID=1180 RepID=UPI002FF954FE
MILSRIALADKLPSAQIPLSISIAFLKLLLSLEKNTPPRTVLEDVLKVQESKNSCESSKHNTYHRNINKSLG